MSRLRAPYLVLFLLSFLAAAVIPRPVAAQMHEGMQLVRAELHADTAAIIPGRTFTAGLLMRLAPGWHTYWQNPGDSGMPTRIDWQLPPGFRAGDIQWPIPVKTIEEGDLWTYAYHDEVMLLVEITPPAQLPEKQVTLKARASWLVCEKICIPGDADLTLTLPVGKSAGTSTGASGAGAETGGGAATTAESAPELAPGTAMTTANADLFAKYRGLLPQRIAPPFQVNWNVGSTEARIELTPVPATGHVDFFPLSGGEGVTLGHPEKRAAGVIVIPVESQKGQPPQITGVLVTGTGTHADASGHDPATSERREGWFVSSSPDAAGGTGTGSISKPGAAGLWTYLGFGFIGGLILNIMPCVLPVIALKIFGFIKQAGETPAKIFRLGLAFVAGIFAWFLVLAALVVAFKAAGRELNWAFQFQHPAFLIAMIVIIGLFALNLLGLFEITLPGRAQNRLVDLSAREGYGGTFLHGVFATLMATPCTAPFLGPALGFALAQSALVIFAMFGAIAAGMSAPYFVLAARPAWLRFMPKPGMWMVRVKQAMGVLLLGTVAWLGWVLWQQQKEREPFSPQLERALRQDKIVFVDFTADWCVNCKVNERLVLKSDAVQAAFREQEVIFLVADWTRGAPDITRLLKQFGRAGVPLYVIYPANGGEPIVLPETLTVNMVLEALRKAATG